jgi:putative sigma-54 modulation protein
MWRSSVRFLLVWAASAGIVTLAFTTPTIPTVRRMTRLAATETEVPVIINGQNIELTPALVEHVNKRIGGQINKLASNGAIQECDVILSVSKNPKVKNGHRVEVVTNLKGTSIICHNESPDMYASIDAASHALYRKLCKYKDNRVAGWHGGEKMGNDIMEVLENLEDVSEYTATPVAEEYVDPEAPTITKVKNFDLTKPMSVQEAVFALDYIDHDFYVFRNAETNEISVVYKRNVGGIGLVEP